MTIDTRYSNTNNYNATATGGTANAAGTTGSSERLEGQAAIQAYLQDLQGPAMSSRYTLAEITSSVPENEIDSRIQNNSWVKSFDKGVQEAVAKLGENPTKGEVDKAVNNEFFKQKIMKFAVDRASSRIMDKVKEMMQDTFK